MVSLNSYSLSVQINLLSNEAANSAYPEAVRGQLYWTVLHSFSQQRKLQRHSGLLERVFVPLNFHYWPSLIRMSLKSATRVPDGMNHFLAVIYWLWYCETTLLILMGSSYHHFVFLHSRFCALGSSAQQQHRGGQGLHTVISWQRHLQCYQQHFTDSAQQSPNDLSHDIKCLDYIHILTHRLCHCANVMISMLHFVQHS